ncbi:MAG: hypothetical protein HZB18_18250 [Chloroflexi bacterium]|nr:hypothetical protein [Chloroflexota bacterium]
MITKPHRYFWIVLFAFLIACGKQIVALPTETAIPTATFTPIPPTTMPTLEFTPVPATVMPTQTSIPIITPDPIQVERWREYQTALAKNVLADLPAEEVLCEWEILDRSGSDVYVWAVCNGKDGGGSVPAIIHLEIDGAIQSVERAKNWSRDIPRLFPPDVREKFAHYQGGRARELQDHIEWRRTHPEEPPLIVLSAMPTATPTP